MPVELSEGLARIGIEVDDPIVVDLLERCPDDEREDAVRQLLAVGAHGLKSMGLSVSLDEIDTRIRRALTTGTEVAARRLQDTIDGAVGTAHKQLDPQHRESATSQTLEALDQWQRELLERLDPAQAGSAPARMLAELHDTVGKEGELERRIRSLFDTDHEDSAVAGITSDMSRRLSEVRDLILEDRGRRAAAERGTDKGFDFEDIIESRLREVAAPHGWIVDRTSLTAGSLHAESKVGDFVVHLDDGLRIAVEAKNAGRITLTGRDGILNELDRAIANRSADYAICVSASEAYPAEVGAFGVYGNRILVVDGGDGVMLGVALRWTRLAAAMVADRAGTTDIDKELVADRLNRMRNLVRRLSGAKRSLTQMTGTIEELRASLDAVRLDISEQLSELETHILARPADVIRLTPVESG